LILSFIAIILSIIESQVLLLLLALTLVERYRLAADGMKTLIGFLSVIAFVLLQLTYLHRTLPSAPAIEILNPLQLRILKAKSPKLPKVLTVSWASWLRSLV